MRRPSAVSGAVGDALAEQKLARTQVDAGGPDAVALGLVVALVADADRGVGAGDVAVEIHDLAVTAAALLAGDVRGVKAFVDGEGAVALVDDRDHQVPAVVAAVAVATIGAGKQRLGGAESDVAGTAAGLAHRAVVVVFGHDARGRVVLAAGHVAVGRQLHEVALRVDHLDVFFGVGVVVAVPVGHGQKVSAAGEGEDLRVVEGPVVFGLSLGDVLEVGRDRVDANAGLGGVVLGDGEGQTRSLHPTHFDIGTGVVAGGEVALGVKGSTGGRVEARGGHHQDNALGRVGGVDGVRRLLQRVLLVGGAKNFDVVTNASSCEVAVVNRVLNQERFGRGRLGRPGDQRGCRHAKRGSEQGEFLHGDNPH